MKRHIHIAAICFMPILFSCASQNNYREDIKNAIRELNHSVSEAPEIEKSRERSLKELKSSLNGSCTPRQEYFILDSLYGLYYKNNVDSALVYAHKKSLVAAHSNDSDLMVDATLDLANRYAISGLYNASLDALSSQDSVLYFSSGNQVEYYIAQNLIWHGLASTTRDANLRDIYHRKEAYYISTIISYGTEDNTIIEYYSQYVNRLIQNKEYKQALALLDRRLDCGELPLEDYPILYYFKAKIYLNEGDTDNALLNFAISADYDVRLLNKEGRSIIQVARLLYERGDVKTAYSFIDFAYKGAVSSDARICLNEISQILPIINDAYSVRERKLIRSLFYALLILVLMLVFLVYGFNALRQYHQEVIDAQSMIKKQNEEIQAANVALNATLGQYLLLFTDHINSLERYRSKLRVTAKQNDIQTIKSELKSDSFIDEERQFIYKEFDNAFLGLFPDFIEQFNALLEPDKHIGEELIGKGTLNTELRIFALIRFGVTDSVKIASFLNKSVSTIYNYRVKARNAAICERDSFESEVMQIQNKKV